MRKRFPICIFLILPTLIFAENTSTLALIADDSTRHVRMDEVVVTSTRAPLSLRNAPVITRVIHAEEIERTGVATIQNLLERELAGVEFHQAGYGSSVSFQGLDARYVLFLIDGERMAGETYGNIDYARIPLADIERIEIVRGASSVMYGSSAMGAVVNIITRMPRQRFEVNASVRYGSRFQSNDGETLNTRPEPSDADLDSYRSRLDLPNLKTDVSMGINLGKFRSLTSLGYRTTDAYRLSGTKDEVRHYDELDIMKVKMLMPGQPGNPNPYPYPEFDPNTGMPVFEVGRTVRDTTVSVAPDSRGLSVSGSREVNATQRFEYELNEKFAFHLSGGYFDRQRYDFQTSITDDNPVSAMISSPWTYETYRGYNVKAQMEHSPNEDHKVYLSYVWDAYRRDLDTLGGGSTHKQRHEYHLPRLLWTWNLNDWNRLTTGVEAIGERLRFDLNAAGFDDLNTMASGAVYVQDELLSGRRLSFVVGLRGDYNNRFGWRATPKASAKFTVADLSLRANYANGYRTPSLKEMYIDFTIPIPGTPSVIRGNDALRPESNHYLSFSAEYVRTWFDVSATLYNSFFRNKIDVRGFMEGTTRVLRYENIDRSELGGVELIARVKPVRGLTLSANYNYIFRHDNAPEEMTQYIFPSPHTATFGAEFRQPVRKWTLGANAALRYVGPKTYEDFMPIVIGDMSNPSTLQLMMGSYTARHEGYAVANGALHAEWNRQVMLTVGMDNLFDYAPQVVNFNSAITAPRNFFLQLAVRY